MFTRDQLLKEKKKQYIDPIRNDTHLNYAIFSELTIGMTLEQDGEYYLVAKTNNKFVTLKNIRTNEITYEPEHFFNNAKYKKVCITGNYTY